MATFRDVDPGDLRLPPGRQDGAVPSRYHRQVSAYGSNSTSMMPIEVTEGRDGEMMINNGVTRATRIHHLAPGKLVTVEITQVKPNANFTRLLRVRDVLPPP
jgi:hypothetical protein